MATEGISVECEHCGNGFRVKPEAEGRSVRCPQCRERTLVPERVGAQTESVGKIDGFTPPPTPPMSEPPQVSSPYSVQPNNDGDAPRIKTGDHPRRYPALRVVQIALYVLAALVVLQWVFSLLFTLYAIIVGNGDDPGAGLMAGTSIMMLLFNTFTSAVSICVLVASGELIRVLLDVQEDTRKTAMYAARMAQ